MATNVRNPILLEVISPTTVETVTKVGATVAEAHLCYNRVGSIVGPDGAYHAGVCTKSTPATDRALPLATSGYAIVRVKPGSAIAVDGAVSVAATGEAIPASTGYVIGRALDASTGTGTAQNPHFIRIKLS